MVHPAGSQAFSAGEECLASVEITAWHMARIEDVAINLLVSGAFG
jgi:hypothetical protein